MIHYLICVNFFFLLLGEMVNGKPHGHGVMQIGAARYEGQWQNGEKHGKGKYYYDDGSFYNGEWKNNFRCGKGQYVHTSGDVYIGSWLNNEKHGEGTIKYAKGGSYEGSFCNGKKHGKGILTKPNGYKYEEEFENGERRTSKLMDDSSDDEDSKDDDDAPPLSQLERSTSKSKGDSQSATTNQSSIKHYLDDDKDDMKETNNLEPIAEIVSEDSKLQSANEDEKKKKEQSPSDALKQNRYDTFDSNNSSFYNEIGTDTMSLVHHANNLESIKNMVLGHEIKEWSVDDVAKWLIHNKLESCVEKFQQNRINGSSLLKLEDKHLENMGITAVGIKINLKDNISKLVKLSQDEIKRKVMKSIRGKSHSNLNLNILKNPTSSLYWQKIEEAEMSYEDENEHEIDSSKVEENHSGDSYRKKESSSSRSPSPKKLRKKSNDTEDFASNKDGKSENLHSLKKESLAASKNILLGNGGFDIEKDLHNESNSTHSNHPPQIPLRKRTTSDDKRTENGSILDNDNHIVSMKFESKESKNTKRDRKDSESSVSSSSSASSDKSLKKKKKKKQEQNKEAKQLVEIELSRFKIDFKDVTFGVQMGEGGYGKIYVGTYNGQRVAIKDYGDKKSKKIEKNFLKEVSVLSFLRHPNILLYMGIIHNHPTKLLMVTEFMEKGSLYDHLHGDKKIVFPNQQIIDLLEDIALGMTYMIDKNFFHCDLKSKNILIDENWTIKLCDFGLSKRAKSKINAGIVGTPNWMAPEILRGEAYREASDVYSFGLVIWEIITNEVPLKGYSFPQIRGLVGYDSTFQMEIPEKTHPLLKQLISGCLKYSPDDRPSFKYILKTIQDYKHNQKLNADSVEDNHTQSSNNLNCQKSKEEFKKECKYFFGSLDSLQRILTTAIYLKMLLHK